jgi:hypothetical protein
MSGMEQYVLSYRTKYIGWGDEPESHFETSTVRFEASSDEKARIRASEEWRKILNDRSGRIIERNPSLTVEPRVIEWDPPVK